MKKKMNRGLSHFVWVLFIFVLFFFSKRAYRTDGLRVFLGHRSVAELERFIIYIFMIPRGFSIYLNDTSQNHRRVVRGVVFVFAFIIGCVCVCVCFLRVLQYYDPREGINNGPVPPRMYVVDPPQG